MSRRYIVLIAQPGLANRLRALAGFAVLARLCGLQLKVQWLPTPACDAPFAALFESTGLADVEFIAPGDAGFRSDPACSAVYESSLHFLEIHARYALPDVSAPEFTRLTQQVLQALRPVPHLQRRIDELAAQLDVGSRIGLHIRMTDNLNFYTAWVAEGFNPAHASRLPGFVALIQRAGERGERVLLATDNAALEQDLVQRFAHVAVVPKAFQMGAFARHHQYAGHTGASPRMARLWRRIRSHLLPGSAARREPIDQPIRGLSRTTAIDDALVDLYLLGRCRRVVATYWSSFGEMAAYVGGIPCSVMLGEQESPPVDAPQTGPPTADANT